MEGKLLDRNQWGIDLREGKGLQELKYNEGRRIILIYKQVE